MKAATLKGSRQKCTGAGSAFSTALVILVAILSFTHSVCLAQLTGNDVIILVNANSVTSRHIGNLYRKYHPDVPLENIIELTGLTDCSGPDANASDEIINRSDYEQYIATPVRNYLIDANHPDRIQQIKVIVTTAGMPYRIEDTDPALDAIVNPASSNGSLVQNNLYTITAASVESELTVLWYCQYDPLDLSPLQNRIVNPYQGYHNSSVSKFERLAPGTKNFTWNYAINFLCAPPKMEGQLDYGFPMCFGTVNRLFNAGDMYLTCRLDGPKNMGESAIPEVHKMLERAKWASNQYRGVNPDTAAIIFDDNPNASEDDNRIYNLDGSVNYWTFDAAINQPPDARTANGKNDYVDSFKTMTSQTPQIDMLNIGNFVDAWNIQVILDERFDAITTYADLDPNKRVLIYATYGTHHDTYNPKTYLLTGGPDSTPILKLSNGAVFTSIESFNALTMFSDAATTQAKIIDFIAIGGSGAIGHAFEPMADASIDNIFLTYNLLADSDGNDIADLTFVEAAFSAIPYLSWSEVVIGDPLMQIHFGQKDSTALNPIKGDINMDGNINILDVRELKKAYGGNLNNPNPYYFNKYNDRADLRYDGVINILDVRELKKLMY